MYESTKKMISEPAERLPHGWSHRFIFQIWSIRRYYFV